MGTMQSARLTTKGKLNTANGPLLAGLGSARAHRISSARHADEAAASQSAAPHACMRQVECRLTAAPRCCSPPTSQDVKLLIRRMVERDPRRRIKMEDICQQPWVAQVGAFWALTAPHRAVQLSSGVLYAYQQQRPKSGSLLMAVWSCLVPFASFPLSRHCVKCALCCLTRTHQEEAQDAVLAEALPCAGGA